LPVYEIHLNIKSEAIFIDSLKSYPLVIRPEIIEVKISPVPLYDLLLYFNEYENIIKLINSSIAAPLIWSWILRPIIIKLNLGYKQNDISKE
jgi:hypothetical protein